MMHLLPRIQHLYGQPLYLPHSSTGGPATFLTNEPRKNGKSPASEGDEKPPRGRKGTERFSG